MKTSVLRSVSLLALASCALAAHAAVAYSNKPAGDYFGTGYSVNAAQSVGYLFTSTATGALTGFDVAINNETSNVPLDLNLQLYADDNGFLGTLLGSYDGLSTGRPFGNTSGYAFVAASGPTLASGASYWLVASSSENLYWGFVDGVSTQRVVSGAPGDFIYQTALSGAFSVQVDPIASAVPGPVAALPFALMALRRRKRS